MSSGWPRSRTAGQDAKGAGDMGAFLTGLAAITLVSVATWFTLQSFTVTTVERYDGTTVTVSDKASSGEAWE